MSEVVKVTIKYLPVYDFEIVSTEPLSDQIYNFLISQKVIDENTAKVLSEKVGLTIDTCKIIVRKFNNNTLLDKMLKEGGF